ncbi:predicted protein [Nematostella vectensis]|uniref:RNA methyltransferase n=1 Tax=Nematostella vectensis TaxID=45351 RepID=A7SJ10_NEMVE|nr:predicted protein [Nematostella vectensis]|eukprot:XP_001628401.1 predicted protein [Nematostella vectensis]
MSKQKQKGKVFIHGNYNRYYGYRNNNQSEDIRLKSFKKEWFQGKDVLDIGCNTGIVTLAIAKNYEPRVIVGSDIDNSLIRIAKSNIRNYVEKPISSTTIASTQFPISFMLTSGPLAAPVLSSNDLSTCSFPKNVVFKQENYVPPHETALSYQKAMYDTILCLSVTKWVHLNNGDQGLKLMFKKMFKNLRPGGKLILEPQPMSSYKRRKNLTEKIRANYDSIKFKPEQFLDYLLSDEVGFAAFEVLNPQDQTQTGFKRPLYLFTKAVQPVNPTSK